MVMAGVFRIPAEQMRHLCRVAVEFAIIISCAWYLVKRVNVWIGLFVALTAVMAIYPEFGRFALLRRDAILMGVGWYVLLKFNADRDLIFNGICVLSIINSLFLILEWCGLDPYMIMSMGLFSSVDSTITGLMTNQNEASVLIGISLPLFFRGRWRWFIPLIALSLLPAESTVGIVCVLTSAIVYMFHRKDTMLGVVVVGILLILLPLYVTYWDANGLSSAWRIRYNLIGLDILKDHPAGIGLGHWHLVTNQVHAHNDILQIIVEMGLVCGVLVGGFFITTFYHTDLMGRTILVSMVVASLVSFSWFIPVTGFVMVSLLAGIQFNRGSYD